MEKENERRKRFFPTISLGSIIAILTFVGAAIGVWSNLYADVRILKENEIKKEIADKESRTEIKQEIREVKQDVKDVNNKLDKVLFELNKLPKSERNGR